MSRVSYDKQSQCWREDPQGKFLGKFDEKTGWKAVEIVGKDYSE